MNKEKILLLLKTRYSNLGFSNKAFDGVADYLSKTVTDDTQAEIVINGIHPILRALQGDMDKVRTEKSELQKKYEELKKQKMSGSTLPPQSECYKNMPEWFVLCKVKQGKKSGASARDHVTFNPERDRTARQKPCLSEARYEEIFSTDLEWLKVFQEWAYADPADRPAIVITITEQQSSKLYRRPNINPHCGKILFEL